MKRSVQLHVNGQAYNLEVEPHQTLLEVLRSELGLHGPRETCGIGVCGVCTVLIDYQPVSACLLLAVLADGRPILTVEGLAQDGRLDPVQEAFVEEMGLQCSYCTPGMILSTHALLRENPQPAEHEIREYLAGNLCRCGSYYKIIAAVKAAARKLSQQKQL